MSAGSKLLIGSSLCAGLALAWALLQVASRGSRPARLDSELQRTEPEPAGSESIRRPAEEQPERRSEVPAAAEAPAQARPAGQPEQLPEPRVVRGRVFHIEGHPLARVRVLALHSAAETTGDRDGRFQIEIAQAYDQLAVEDARYVTLRSSEVGPANVEVDHPILVADSIRAAGTVVDKGASPIAGAEVRLVLEREVYGDVPAALDTTRQAAAWSTESDGQGRFAFEALPAVPRGMLETQHPSYATRKEPAPVVSDPGLLIVLERPEASAAASGIVLAGRVLLPNGGPAAGAAVSLGDNKTEVSPSGDFALRIGSWRLDDNLVAVLGGLQPAVLEDFGATVQLSGDEREPIVLVLPGPALEIRGRVVDAGGAPCAGWDIKLRDGTVVDGSFPPLFAEDHAAGGEGKSSNMQKTGADGGFRMSGLRLGRSYVLRVWDEPTLRSHESEPILAGSLDVRLVVPTDHRARVWGRVLGLDGSPLVNVHVRLTMRVHEFRGNASYHTGQELHTAADGRFEFADVPRVDLLLRFTGETIDNLYHELGRHDPGQDLEIRLARRCHLRIERSAGPDAPDAIRVLDADGQELLLKEVEAGQSSGRSRVPLVDGASGVLATSERARWLVFERDGAEIGRRPLRLVPGEVASVRY